MFIGSSKEGLTIAKKLQKALGKKFPTFLDCKLWTDGEIFSLNKGTLDSLTIASRKFDYGILIATADDIRRSRNVKTHIPRDNVMFEMGMFIGSLGLSRAFLLVEKSATLPTDYNGVTVAFFEKDINNSLEKAIKKVAAMIENTQLSYNLKPVPAAALALSYFDNFIFPLAKKRLKDKMKFKLKILLPQNLSNIRTTSLDYSKKHKSEEISVFDDGGRPRVNKLLGIKQNYWDIPTTLSTLYKLINIVVPSNEIGVEKDKHDWIEHELRNFKGTLEVLISQCDACKNNVEVNFLNN
jgi:Predicted nucleotide-binding protein containing TIR-like domain